MDVGFHDFFRVSPMRTFEPRNADFFFVPSYACCHQVAGIHKDFAELDNVHIAVVQQLQYFKRSGGRDHIFSMHYVDLFPSWRKYIPNSIFLTPETEIGFERSLADFQVDSRWFPPFNPLKDLSVPPFISPKDILSFHQHSRASSEREHLACFAGKLWNDVTEAAAVRHAVKALGSLPGVKVYAEISMKDLLSPEQMQQLMGNSRFCLVPRGRAAWSVRFFESLLAGCVPVLLSDHYDPPFDALFDLSELLP
eukprot:3297442-Amphidinium_carterae.1